MTLSDRIEARPFGDHYMVTSEGEVWSNARGSWKLLKPGPQKYGKLTLLIDGCQKHMRLNRVVCEAFHGPPPTPEHVAMHRDGNSRNDRASNLSWGTHSENMRDQIRHGTLAGPRNSKNSAMKRTGDLSPARKIRSADVVEILSLLSDGRESYSEIGSRFGVSKYCIYLIAKGETWKTVPRPPQQRTVTWI